VEESVRDINLPHVFRHFLEGLRKIKTKSVRTNGSYVDINPKKTLEYVAWIPAAFPLQ